MLLTDSLRISTSVVVRHVYGNHLTSRVSVLLATTSQQTIMLEVSVQHHIFRTNLKDKIQFSPADDEVKKFGYSYQWENVDDAYVQGVELVQRQSSSATSMLVLTGPSIKVSLSTSVQTGQTLTMKTVKEFPQRLQYAKDSRNISRFPAMTGDIDLDYTPGTWTFSLTSSLQGRMFHRLQL